MRLFNFSPETRKRLARFRRIKRGYYSFVIFVFLIAFSLVAELFISNRALYVSYQGKSYFPTYGGNHPGRDFGLDYDQETNYRELKKIFEDAGNGDTVILPIVPFDA